MPVLVREFKRGLASLAALFLAVVLLSGCSVRLAPDYDAAIVAKLDTLNESLSKLFLGFDEQKAYADRKTDYDANQAVLSALIMRLQARPSPEPLVIGWLASKSPSKEMSKILRESDAPSIFALQKAQEKLAWMVALDQKKQLSHAIANLTWNEMKSFLIDAMVYEQALNR